MFNILSEAAAKEHFSEWEVGWPGYDYDSLRNRIDAAVEKVVEEHEDTANEEYQTAARATLTFAFTEFFNNLRVELYRDGNDMQLEIETTSQHFEDFSAALEPVSLRKVILDTAFGFNNSYEVVGFLIKGLRALADELESAPGRTENTPGTGGEHDDA